MGVCVRYESGHYDNGNISQVQGTAWPCTVTEFVHSATQHCDLIDRTQLAMAAGYTSHSVVLRPWLVC